MCKHASEYLHRCSQLREESIKSQFNTVTQVAQIISQREMGGELSQIQSLILKVSNGVKHAAKEKQTNHLLNQIHLETSVTAEHFFLLSSQRNKYRSVTFFYFIKKKEAFICTVVTAVSK